MPLGKEPANMTCPTCQERITTNITEETSAMGYIGALLCCVLGLWCGCCLIPINQCKEVSHFCPKCKAFLGKYT